MEGARRGATLTFIGFLASGRPVEESPTLSASQQLIRKPTSPLRSLKAPSREALFWPSEAPGNRLSASQGVRFAP
jgi:hypothetical protein